MKAKVKLVSDLPVPTRVEHAEGLCVAVALAIAGETALLEEVVGMMGEYDSVLRALEEKGYTHLDGSAREIIANNLRPNVDEKENY